jgi:hypothetical protein
MIQLAYLGFPDGKPWVKDAFGFAAPPLPMSVLLQPIAGAPRWIRSEKYTIEAEAAVPQTEAVMRGPMMQALLERTVKR